MSSVPKGSEPAPGAFALAVSEEMRLALTRHRMSGAQLAVKIQRSQSYISKRLRGEASFSANDVAAACEVMGEDLLRFLTAAVRGMRNS